MSKKHGGNARTRKHIGELKQQIREVAGRRRTVVLVPDFESVSGVNTRGRSRKPKKAWARYSGDGNVPAALQKAVEKVRQAARG